MNRVLRALKNTSLVLFGWQISVKTGYSRRKRKEPHFSGRSSVADGYFSAGEKPSSPSAVSRRFIVIYVGAALPYIFTCNSLQEFSIKQGVVGSPMGVNLGFIWIFSRNRAEWSRIMFRIMNKMVCRIVNERSIVFPAFRETSFFYVRIRPICDRFANPAFFPNHFQLCAKNGTVLHIFFKNMFSARFAPNGANFFEIKKR